jgi:hypothetical protein
MVGKFLAFKHQAHQVSNRERKLTRLVNPAAYGQVGLSVKVHHKYPLALLEQGVAQVADDGALSDSTFLKSYYNDFCHNTFAPFSTQTRR